MLKSCQLQVEGLCRHYGVRHLAVFGSLLREDFDPRQSDLDLAVEFSVECELSPARQYFDPKAALEELFGRSVDLVELAAMPDSRLRRLIERTQVSLYEEGGAGSTRGCRMAECEIREI